MDYLRERLREKSTWAAIVTVVALAGGRQVVDPAYADALTTVLVIVSSAVLAIINEKK